MKRRSFLKTAGASGMLMLVKPSGLLYSFASEAKLSMQEGFLSPPSSARPHVFYLFMNGHITAEGITKDLEAMKRVGIGGVLNYNAGIAIPKGPVEYFSDEWYSLLRHTVKEAQRLDLDYSMHNCPGWSSSGGPWVTPEMAMQRIAWSETVIAGGKKIRKRLPMPLTRNNYYRDTFVIAYPSFREEQSWIEKLVRINTNKGRVPIENLSNGRGIEIHKDPGKPGYILFEFSKPIHATALMINGLNISPGAEGIYSAGPLQIEASDDGEVFSRIGTTNGISLTHYGRAEFSEVTSRYIRLVSSNAASIRIDELFFYKKEQRLPDWLIQADYTLRPADTVMTEPAPYAGKRPRKPVMLKEPAGYSIASENVIKADSILDLTNYMNAAGELEWDAPAGNWTILRFGHTCTGVTNRAAPDNGQGLECDKFSREAFDQHFNGMMERVLPILKTLPKGKAGIEIDSYEVGMQNWTRKFPEEFKKSRGYDLIKFMPVFTGRAVESQKISENFLWDARRVMADMMAENYYGRCAELCHQNGLLFYGEPYKLGPMENIQAGSKMDNVMGEFWARGQRNKYALKLAASIQHLNGRKIIAAESFTGHAAYSKWQQFPFAMKAQGDYMFTKGLTRIIFHTSAHQPHPTAKPGMTMGPFGTHIDRNVTWFEQGKAWMKYLSRCQYMLQQGLFAADLLYYTGEDAPGEDLALKETPVPVPPQGYDFDYINTETLLNKISIKDGRIMLPDGMSYSVLFLPQKPAVTLPVLYKLRDLVKQGMRMSGPKPIELSGLADYPEGKEKLKMIADEIWGAGDTERSYGKGKVFQLNSAQDVLDKLNIEQDFSFTAESSDPAVNYIHRILDGADLYFIGNRKRRYEKLVCSFRMSGKKPEYWDTDTGKITPVTLYHEYKGRINVPVHLQPSGSVFIVFRKNSVSKSLHSIKKDGKTLITAAPFTVKPAGRYKNLFNNFGQCVWLKPESDIAMSGMNVMRREDVSSFAFYPSQGELLYGKGHAVCGAAAGRNGIVVYERVNERINPVFEVVKPLSGWTHLALVYRSGVPSVYINGELAGTGEASNYTVHPCIGEEYQDNYSVYFEGDINRPQLLEKALTAAEVKRAASGIPAAAADYPDVELLSSGRSDIILWKNGNYEFEGANGTITRLAVSELKQPIDISRDWDVNFPDGTGAPSKIKLPELISLHKHPDEGVRFFSGTALYSKTFTIELSAKGREVFLDLGQAEVIAEVELNGKNLGILWKKPFRVNISEALKTGENILKVKVTNLWPNRLIGDEQYPQEYEYSDRIFEGQEGYGIKVMPEWYVKGEPKPESKRIAFSTWRHFEKDSPLLESGLIGPVTIRPAVRYVS